MSIYTVNLIVTIDEHAEMIQALTKQRDRWLTVHREAHSPDLQSRAFEHIQRLTSLIGKLEAAI